ncbi:MAG: DUF4249 domain-containing protein [Draconibacterium sp.]
MKKLITYCLILGGIFAACEDIYTPEIETQKNVIVADARIVVGSIDNYVKIYQSVSFNDDNEDYPGIPDAKVTLLDSDGNRFELQEEETGSFPVDIQFNDKLEYKIKIEYDGDTYESEFESVPKVPAFDTIYGIPGEKVIVPTGSNDVKDFQKKEGIQLYVDMATEKEMPYYRFTERKILQYYFLEEVNYMGEVLQLPVYGWYSYYSKESFNIAAPTEYSSSTEIIKHPVSFLEKEAKISFEYYFDGWILIFYQYGISESVYNYYNDLNSQLDSEGRLFDPLYVQARNNLKCINNSNKLILGNFEISKMKEYRYFVKYVGENKGYIIKPIPYFYDIPFSGKIHGPPPIGADPPDFWEYEKKVYPDE